MPGGHVRARIRIAGPETQKETASPSRLRAAGFEGTSRCEAQFTGPRAFAVEGRENLAIAARSAVHTFGLP